MRTVANITISVEILEAHFRKDYSVDAADPLTDLVRRISEEEGFPLRTPTGRPIAWTAEGPSWRPGKTENTDLVRTQSLDKIAQRFLDEGGSKAPLFAIALDIPGAAEAIGTRRAEQKLDSIDETLQQRRRERLDELNTDADFTMDTAEQNVIPDPVALPLEPPPPPPPAARAPQAPPPSAPAPPDPKPVESRIRRAPSGPRKKPRRTAAPKRGAGLSKSTLVAIGGGGCVVLLVIVAIAVVLLVPKKEPPPAVVAAPAPAPMPVAVPVVAPPPPKAEAPTPPPLKSFFSRKEISRSSAASAAAALTSFAKENIRLSYTVRQTQSGSHTVSLKGRFSVTITEKGGIVQTSAGHPISRGAAIGKDTRVHISNLDGAVSVKVGGKRYGPYSVPASGSFPAWKISIKSGATLHNMKASARAE